MPWIRNEMCDGCAACVKSCPAEAITMNNGKAVIDQISCTKCGLCLTVCPQNAIRPNSENPQLAGGGRGFARGGSRRGGPVPGGRGAGRGRKGPV